MILLIRSLYGQSFSLAAGSRSRWGRCCDISRYRGSPCCESRYCGSLWGNPSFGSAFYGSAHCESRYFRSPQCVSRGLVSPSCESRRCTSRCCEGSYDGSRCRGSPCCESNCFVSPSCESLRCANRCCESSCERRCCGNRFYRYCASRRTRGNRGLRALRLHVQPRGQPHVPEEPGHPQVLLKKLLHSLTSQGVPGSRPPGGVGRQRLLRNAGTQMMEEPVDGVHRDSGEASQLLYGESPQVERGPAQKVLAGREDGSAHGRYASAVSLVLQGNSPATAKELSF